MKSEYQSQRLKLLDASHLFHLSLLNVFSSIRWWKKLPSDKSFLWLLSRCECTAVDQQLYLSIRLCSSNSIRDSFAHVFYGVFTCVSILYKVSECLAECEIEIPMCLSPEAGVTWCLCPVPFKPAEHIFIHCMMAMIAVRQVIVPVVAFRLKCKFMAVDRQPCQTDSVQLK